MATKITVYAAPNPLTAGRRVRVFGQLVGFRRGVKRCGIAIVLWRRFPNQRGYTPVARTRTLAGGRYRFMIPARSVTTNRDWVTTTRGLRSRVLVDVFLKSDATPSDVARVRH